jgi:FMN phosphatase YigB (HAD superfamily)
VLCKPNRRCFEAVLERLGGVPAERVVFLDDSTRNCAAAHALGISTVLIGRDGHHPGCDLAVPAVHDLPRVLPSLFAPWSPPRVEAVAEAAVPIRVPA